MLEHIFNFTSLEIVNGKECIDYLENLYRDKQCSCPNIMLIFMDIEMPIMNGVEATQKI